MRSWNHLSRRRIKSDGEPRHETSQRGDYKDGCVWRLWHSLSQANTPTRKLSALTAISSLIASANAPWTQWHQGLSVPLDQRVWVHRNNMGRCMSLDVGSLSHADLIWTNPVSGAPVCTGRLRLFPVREQSMPLCPRPALLHPLWCFGLASPLGCQLRKAIAVVQNACCLPFRPLGFWGDPLRKKTVGLKRLGQWLWWFSTDPSGQLCSNWIWCMKP